MKRGLAVTGFLILFLMHLSKLLKWKGEIVWDLKVRYMR